MKKHKKLEDLNITEIKQAVADNPPVLIIGSIVSIFHPSVLPTGYSAKCDIVQHLITGNVFIRKFVPSGITNDIVNNIPFEQLFEMCPDKTKAKTILSTLFESSEPNTLHKALIQLLLAGRVHSIITTNYDRCLEKAAKQAGRDLHTIVYPKDIKPEKDPVLFKIHGSCDNNGDSIVFDLKDETRLSDWKRTLLNDLTSNRYLFFIGYSGSDFEICPEIESNDSIAGILWCDTKTGYPSQNAKYILEKPTSAELWSHVECGIIEFVNIIFDKQIEAHPTDENQSLLVNQIKSSFTLEEQYIWALNILTVMGYPSIAYHCADELCQKLDPESAEYSHVLYQLGATSYNMGDYKRSITIFKRYRRVEKHIYQRIATLFSIFESRRTGMFFLSAIWTYIYAITSIYFYQDKLLKEEMNQLSKIRYSKKDDLYTSIFRYLGFLKPLFKKSRQRNRDIVKSLSNINGDIGLRKLMGPDHMFDNPVNNDQFQREIVGFQQLGKYFEEAVTFRRYIEFKIRAKTVSPLDYTELRTYMVSCLERGIYPEAMKISLLLGDYAVYNNTSEKCSYSFYGRGLIKFNWSGKAQ